MEEKRRLSEIKIKSSFENTTPKEYKLKECRNFWKEYGKQDRYIVVDHNGYLVDGYIQYLVLKENNIEEAEIVVSDVKRSWWKRKVKIVRNVILTEPAYRHEPTTYVYGYHPNCKNPREFVWRIPKNWKWMKKTIQPGDVVVCATKYGKAPVVVTRVETLKECPTDLPVRLVVGGTIKRNGMILP